MPRRFFLGVLLLTVLYANPGYCQQRRYWYDLPCEHEYDALLEAITRDGIVLRQDDGTRFTLKSVSPSGELFLDACGKLDEAATQIGLSPYRSSGELLRRIAVTLKSHHVAAKLADSISHPIFPWSRRQLGDRDLSQLRNEWVWLDGNRYKIRSLRLDDTQTGIAELIVDNHLGQPATINPKEFRKISLLLPAHSVTKIDLSSPSGSAIRSPRGVLPPTYAPVAAEFEWKYALTYSPELSAWTDEKTEKGLRLMAEADRLWDSSRVLAVAERHRFRIAETKRLYTLADRETLSGRTARAIGHYRAAISLMPDDMPEAATIRLRLGAALFRHGSSDNEAAAFLTDAIKSAEQRESVILPALELRSRIQSRLAAHVESDELIFRKHDAAIADAKQVSDPAYLDRIKGIPKSVSQLLRTLHTAAADRGLADLTTEIQLDAGNHLLQRADELARNAVSLRDRAEADKIRLEGAAAGADGILMDHLKRPDTSTWGEEDFRRAISMIEVPVDNIISALVFAERATLHAEKAKELGPTSLTGKVGQQLTEYTFLATGINETAAVWQRALSQYEDRFSGYWQRKRNFLRAIDYALRAASHDPTRSARAREERTVRQGGM